MCKLYSKMKEVVLLFMLSESEVPVFFRISGFGN